MKTRTQIIVVAAVLTGLAALSSGTKRGGRAETGKCSGGPCCPMLPGLNVWSTSSLELAAATNAKPAAAVGETITNDVQ